MNSMRTVLKGLQATALIITISAVRADGDPNPLAQIQQSKVGLFVHYVFGESKGKPALFTPMNHAGKAPKNIDELADAFDAKKLADFAEKMGAEYVVFTTFHAGMNMLYPSKVMGDILPGKVSKRDVIRDVQTALAAKNIPLVLYWHPSDSHDLNESEKATIASKYKDFGEFATALIKETSSRYGSSVAGYWFDAPSATSRRDFKAIVEKERPHPVIWANGNFKELCTLLTKECAPDFYKNPDSDTWTNSITQMCVLSGKGWWAKPNAVILVKAPALLRYTVRLAGTKGQTNGGVCWSESPYGYNTWATGVEENYAQLGEMLRARKESIFGTVPSTSYVTEPRTVQSGTWGVATDAADGKKVYLHVLNPPSGLTLDIPKAADGRSFASASLLDGRCVKLVPTGSGYSMTLPDGAKWDELDTVIALRVEK